MGEGEPGDAVGDGGFEKVPHAHFERAFGPCLPFGRRPDRYTFTTGGPHPHRMTVSGTRFRTIAHAHRRAPVAVVSVGTSTWWAFRGEAYRDHRGRDARVVLAIMTQGAVRR